MSSSLRLTTPSVKTAFLLTALIFTANFSGVVAMTAPFTASCALVALMPSAPFSRPRTLMLSHLICITIGALLAALPLPTMLLVLMAGWLAIVMMAKMHAIHAPAAAHAVVLSLGNQNIMRYVIYAAIVTLIFTIFSFSFSQEKNQ